MKKSQLRQIIREEISRVLKEVGEGTSNPYEWEELSSDEWRTHVIFTTDSGTDYQVELEYFKSSLQFAEGLPSISFEFSARTEDEDEFSGTVITNKGEVYRVMATMSDILQHYLKDNKVIMYTPEKKPGENFGKQRDMLYKAFIKKKFPNVEFKQVRETIVALLPNN